jgi:ribosomal protein S18 acetylase RimI-like enzyme
MTESGTGLVAIAPVRPEEHDALGRICIDAYARLGYPLRPEYAAQLADVSGRAADPNAVVLAAHLDGELAGHATVVLGPSPLADHVEPGDASLRMVAVAPAAQGRGVGTALVRAALECAVAAGRQRMRLYTQPQMHDAQHIYEQLGFRRVPERDTTALQGTMQLLAYERSLVDPA